MSTFADWVSAFQSLTVSGVATHYNAPPPSVDLADGPAAFPMLPAGERGEPVGTCADMSKARRMTYVIVVAPVAQGTNAEQYAKLAALMDALETALDGLTVTNFVEYTIAARADYAIGDAMHWAIVADVTGRDA